MTEGSPTNEKETKHNTGSSIFLAILACTAVGGIWIFFQNAPVVELKECQDISLPFMINGVLPKWLGGRDDKIATVKAMWQCASLYKEFHSTFVLSSFCLVYIALQMFAIPGPIILSILSGALYPFVQAQILVAFCATTGASLCFMLSYFLGRSLVNKLLPGMIKTFKEKVNYLTFNILHLVANM